MESPGQITSREVYLRAYRAIRAGESPILLDEDVELLGDDDLAELRKDARDLYGSKARIVVDDGGDLVLRLESEE
jgi:hypothetical protein